MRDLQVHKWRNSCEKRCWGKPSQQLCVKDKGLDQDRMGQTGDPEAGEEVIHYCPGLLRACLHLGREKRF